MNAAISGRSGAETEGEVRKDVVCGVQGMMLDVNDGGENDSGVLLVKGWNFDRS